MKFPQIGGLSKESSKEFGALLLLDHLMQFELLQIEKIELVNIIDQLENGVTELKKGFFRSDEQEQKLTYEKEELREAKNAFTRLLKGETFDQVVLSGSNSALKVPDTLMNLSKVREYIGPSLMREAQLLKPGQFSEPKKVSDGYKIIYLVDREDAAKPEYSNIRSSVLSEFSKRRDDQSLRTYLDNLKKWYDVSRNLEE